MGFSIDWFNSIVNITSPTIEVDTQTLHDFIEDQMASPVGMQHSAVIQPEGKIEDPSNPGIFSQIIMVLNSPWQIQFWGGSGYTRIFGGKIVGGLSDQPMKATGTANDITVLESPVDGVTVAVADQTQVSDIHGQVVREVWLDPSLVSNGNGYQQSPYNNLTDAIDDAELNGITTLVLLDDITLNRNLKNFAVRGIGVPSIDLAGFDLKGSEFRRVKLTGTYIDEIIAQESVLLPNFFLNGFFENCALAGDLFCVDGASIFMKNCASAIAGLGRPTISMNGAGWSKLSVRGHGGGLTIKDCNNVLDEVTVEMGQKGSVTFDASCTAGSMVIRTDGKFVDLTAGANVTVEAFSQDIWQSRGLDKDNPLLITDDDRNAGDISQTIVDDETTTTVTRQ